MRSTHLSRAIHSCALLLAVSLTAAACAASTPVQAQSAKVDSGGAQAAPVDQSSSPIIVAFYAPTMASAADPKSAPLVTVQIGHQANGDVRAAESNRQGAQTGGAQSASATQTTSVDPAAVAGAAGELLKVATPGGQAESLAKTAARLASEKDPRAAEVLKLAQEAEKSERK